MRRNHVVRGLAAGLVGTLSITGRADAQTEAWRALGVSSLPSVGGSVAFIGDVNGDGVPDFVAGGRDDFFLAGNDHALLCSGADGSILFDFVGAVGAGLGRAVANAGDVDADGIDDVAVGAPAEGNGSVYLYSGATGALLRTLSSSSPASLFGTSLASLGDLDGDGVAELAVGAPADVSSGSRLGLAVIYSGSSGSVLAQLTGATVDGDFGSVVDDAGDVDGDGLHDLLVVEQADTTSGTASGTLRIYSGATFSLLQQWNLGAHAGGWTARGAGDVNGDGIVDAIVGNDLWPVTQLWPYVWGRGGVWVIDGASGANLYTYTQFLETGLAVSGAGDVDGDGDADFAFDCEDMGGKQFHVVSGRDGSTLAVGYVTNRIGSLSGGVDVDGDGAPDLVVGMPYDSTNGAGAGAAGIFSSVQQAFIRKAFGPARDDMLGQTSALLDDVDGDGIRDVLVGTDGIDRRMGFARILSGRDGSELRVHSGASFDDGYGRTVAALPDLDGDSIGEYAITAPGPENQSQGFVEIRSGATGALLRTIAPAGGGPGNFGSCCAAAIQPSGATQLAVGSPGWGASTGALFVFDVATGATVIAATGPATYYGVMSVAWLGDMDGDGTGDWAAGFPSTTESVVIFSGLTGSTIKTLTNTGSKSGFGTATCGAGDLDGDGTPDLFVGAPGAKPQGRGAVYLYSGATLNLLQTWPGTEYGLGSSITAIGDVNRDGSGDVLFGQRSRAWLISGATGGVLYRFDGRRIHMYYDYLGWSSAGVAAPGSTGSMNGDPIPDVAIGAYADSTNGGLAGRISLYFLDDLYLQVDPPKASAGDTLNLTTSGGPSGNLSALFLLAFDGTPLVVPLAFGTFDSAGLWSLSGTVPNGLAGHTLTLESFAIGFMGKVVDTQAMPLVFD